MGQFENTNGLTFEVQRHVRHGHTDPAGIVYYPRYYEMINDTVEDFFRDVLGFPFGKMHMEHHVGVPTVEMQTTFLKPSFCDEVLTFCFQITHLGTSSLTYEMTVLCESEKRLSASATLVHISTKTMKSVPFAQELREKLSHYLKAEAGTENG